jgi:hypothetical protein
MRRRPRKSDKNLFFEGILEGSMVKDTKTGCLYKSLMEVCIPYRDITSFRHHFLAPLYQQFMYNHKKNSHLFLLHAMDGHIVKLNFPDFLCKRCAWLLQWAMACKRSMGENPVGVSVKSLIYYRVSFTVLADSPRQKSVGR